MKRTYALILSILLITAAAIAQQPADNPDPATQEQILKMMDAMQARNQIKSVMTTMQQQVSAMMDQQFQKMTSDAPPEMRAEMSAAMQDMMKDMEPLMSDMIGEMVPVYQKHLSRTEADAITAFYMSPEGQSFLKKMPMIMSDSMSLAMKSMNEKMRPIIEKMTKRMEDITKKYTPQNSSAPQSRNTSPATKPAGKSNSNNTSAK